MTKHVSRKVIKPSTLIMKHRILSAQIVGKQDGKMNCVTIPKNNTSVTKLIYTPTKMEFMGRSLSSLNETKICNNRHTYIVFMPKAYSVACIHFRKYIGMCISSL